MLLLASVALLGSCAHHNRIQRIEHDGEARRYHLYAPRSIDPEVPAPLLLSFHGRTSRLFGTAWRRQMQITQMRRLARAEGFLLAHPQGLNNASDGDQTWNASSACCADDLERDDLGFTRALVDEIDERYAVDWRRIYATGFSNGGYFSYELACEAADLIAAVAPVGASMGPEACDPSRPVAVMALNGTEDALVSYDKARAKALGWVERNGCDPEPTESFQNGDSSCLTWSGCEWGAEVTFCTIEGGGHCWPGGRRWTDLAGFGHTTRDIDANAEMWQFFLAHPQPLGTPR